MTVPHFNNINQLGTLGFKIPNQEKKLCKSIAEVHAFIQSWEEKRDDYEYEIDGMVIKVNDIDLQKARSIGSSILFDDIYGIDFNETFKASEKYRQITSAQIQKLAQKIFAQPAIVALVGKEDVAS